MTARIAVGWLDAEVTISAPAPAIAWHRSRLVLGLMLALPPVVVIPRDPPLGLALAVGTLPAAATSLPPRRRDRIVIPILSALFAACLAIGALLGTNAVVAVVGIVALCVLASVAAEHSRLGLLALRLAVPLIGVGLSFDEASTVLATAVLLVAGGLWAYLVALLWPERTPPTRRGPAESEQGQRAPGDRGAPSALDFGIRLGLAAGTAAALGFAFSVDHKGWMCGAVLFVMRPDTDALLSRSLGRAGSVVLGGLGAAAFWELQPGPLVLTAVIGAVVAVMTATQGSRWYITPAFSTFLVLSVMTYGDPAETTARFWQRTWETAVGVALALVFGWLVPYLRTRSAATRR